MSVRALLAGTAIVVQSLSLQAAESDIEVLIEQELHARTHCLTAGHSDIPEDLVWCRVQEALRQALLGKGWCFGKQGEPMAEYRWHRCVETSVVTPE